MKVILDTNVVFAAFTARGLAHSLFELCIDKHTIIISNHILGELKRAFLKKLKLPPDTIKLILNFLKEICIIEDSAEIKDIKCRDKDDLKILGLAKNSKPDYIITGDNDLLVLKQFLNIPIVRPREFWQRKNKKIK